MSDFTQEHLTALNEAIATGTLRVRYQDKDIQYRSLDEMLKTRALIKQELAAQANVGGGHNVGRSRGVYDSGL